MKQTIDYLYLKQETNGSFISQSSPSLENFRGSIAYRTTFFTSLILSSLCTLEETPQLKIIKTKAAKFLLSQKSKFWSWNYWDRDSKEAKTSPYPDDLDDTFCALTSLYLFKKKLINGESFANIVNLLTTLEIREGGPYRTWIINNTARKTWRDVDLAVNSNIFYFLFLNEIELPNLSKFIDSKIIKSNFLSPYYPSPLPIIYFISRFYRQKNKEKIIDYLLKTQNQKSHWGNPLNTALAVSSLLNLNFKHEKLKQSIKYLLKNKKNGHWQPYGFCYDPSIAGRKYFAGSEYATSAFCLEAIEKYRKVILETQNSISYKAQDKKQEKIYNEILKNVRKRLVNFDNSFVRNASLFVKKLTKNNTDKQILLLPYYFAKSIDNKKNIISDKLFIQLGTASLFGWIAYTIYDNFMDEEGDPKTLSLANLALRESALLFSNSLLTNKNWQIFFKQILDKIDAANYWEIKNCRDKNKMPNYGDYEKLAEKSLGHALGPLAILFSLEYDEKSKDVKNLIKFFKHYLIARQLNDEAHDWEKDYKMGYVNPVVALILKKSSSNLSLYHLKKIFWESVIDELSTIIFKHVKIGKLALNKCSIISDKSLFESMIIKYENTALKSIEEKKQAVKFLKIYKK